MKKDIQRVDVTEEHASDRVRWRHPTVGTSKGSDWKIKKDEEASREK